MNLLSRIFGELADLRSEVERLRPLESEGTLTSQESSGVVRERHERETDAQAEDDHYCYWG
jgi:hypothetical protein